MSVCCINAVYIMTDLLPIALGIFHLEHWTSFSASLFKSTTASSQVVDLMK